MLSSIASGTGGAMKNISQAKLKALRLPIPPSQLQRQFVTRIETVRAIATHQATAQAKAQATYDGLLQQVFAHPETTSIHSRRPSSREAVS
jgi:restriction endonuclease S subunit